MVGLEPAVAVLEIDVYTVVGTTGECSASYAAYGTIPEMTKTLTLETGDIVIITFQADFKPSTDSAVYFRIKAGDTVLGYRAQWGTSATSVSLRDIRTSMLQRIYTATADGDVTFVTEWKLYGSGDTMAIRSNDREMSLIHIHS